MLLDIINVICLRQTNRREASADIRPTKREPSPPANFLKLVESNANKKSSTSTSKTTTTTAPRPRPALPADPNQALSDRLAKLYEETMKSKTRKTA